MQGYFLPRYYMSSTIRLMRLIEPLGYRHPVRLSEGVRCRPLLTCRVPIGSARRFGTRFSKGLNFMRDSSDCLSVDTKKPRTILGRGQERMSDTVSSLGEVWLTYR